MAQSTGNTSVSGTGIKTILTGLATTPTWAELSAGNVDSFSIGHADGTNQSCVTHGPIPVNSSSRMISLQNSSGVTVFECSFSSFGISGSNGKLSINVTTNSVGAQGLGITVGT